MKPLKTFRKKNKNFFTHPLQILGKNSTNRFELY
jgi:hypothetical protein